ncbi:MAG: protein translocase subunit SecD [Pseudomonadota bacterium]
MLQFPLWKTLLTVGLCLAGLVFAAPNLFYDAADGAARAKAEIERLESRGQPVDPALIEQAEAWPAWAPPGVVSLGLDLRGGAHLLVEVQIAEVVAERMQNLRDDVRRVLRDADVRRFTGLVAEEGSVRITISNAEQVDTAGAALRSLAQPVGGGIAGGFGMGGIAAGQDLEVSLDGDGQTWRLTLSEAALTELTDRTMAQSLEVMRRRIDETGTREPTIQRQGEDRILIQVPGIGSAAELLELIGRTAKLTFHSVEGFGETSYNSGPGQLVVGDAEGGAPYLIERKAILSGDNLTDASLGFHPDTGLPVVNFRFDSSGARVFGDYTAANVGRLFATVLDGEVITAPRIQSPILGGAGFIEGSFTVESATQLAILLRSGALPASIKTLEQRTVGPDLGADSIAAGSAATMLAFGAVLIFMIAAYGRFGMFAAIALVLNLAMLIALLSVIGATLTLPGIAGIVLTIGMAVDANVLIFERIREELRSAKGPARAIDKGYSEAVSAIVDANITTLIAAIILFAIGSGPVKGFAVTLGLGILTSVFTAFMVTRLMVITWLDRVRPKVLKVALLRLVPEKTSVNFLSLRRATMGLSSAACIGSIAVAAMLGLNFGIDFRGGTMLEIRTQQSADLGAIRQVVTDMELGDVAVQSFGSDRDVLVRVEEQAGDGDDRMAVAEDLGKVLQSAFPGSEIRRVEVVGPKVSSELLQAGALAILLAVLAVLIYIWLRFEWQFGLGAVVALVHDVLLTIGIFALTGIEFNLAIIAAILTIVGYSLNDTVVVFDRVRENLRKYKKMPLIELLNLSINETLARTVMTSVTTLIALGAMFFLGPPVIQGFTFAMIWGVVIGTYSSVFVAAATLLWLGVKRDWSTAEEAKAGVRLDGAQV